MTYSPRAPLARARSTERPPGLLRRKESTTTSPAGQIDHQMHLQAKTPVIARTEGAYDRHRPRTERGRLPGVLGSLLLGDNHLKIHFDSLLRVPICQELSILEHRETDALQRGSYVLVAMAVQCYLEWFLVLI